MKSFTQAAKQAHDTLTAAHAEAMSDAQARLKSAEQATSPEAVRPQLIELLNQADQPGADAVATVITSYAAMMPQHLARDGAALVSHLTGIKRHKGLSDAQAGQVVRAILAALNGCPAGLIEWPAADLVLARMPLSDLHLWAQWGTPDGYSTFTAAQEAAVHSHYTAVRDLAYLEQQAEALAALAAPVAEVLRLKSNSKGAQSVAGITFEPGEIRELTPAEYAGIYSRGDALARLIESHILEVA